MRLGEPDASGRPRPEPIPDDFFTLEVDNIIAAIGQNVETGGLDSDLELSDWDTIEADENTFLTNRPGVFAGGDGVTGPSIAIEAIADGRRAAEVIDNYLEGSMKPYQTYYDSKVEDLTSEDFVEEEKKPRVGMPATDPETRITNFQEVEQGITAEEATEDARRCLECGCFDLAECELRDLAICYDANPERIVGEEHDYEEEIHPFIIRDRNKCILCGLCVRTCSEIVGAEALGLVNRGFDVFVSPPLELPLTETDCYSCGQCVYVCPTGALMENIPLEKPTPWQFEGTDSICGFCGVGCSLRYEYKGNSLGRSLPRPGPVSDEKLCKGGRFGFEYVNDKERLRKPMIRENGELKEVDWETALDYLVKKTSAIKERSGGDSMAVFAGPRYTNEEAYQIQKFSRAVLKTNNLNSLTEPDNPLSRVLGWGASTSSLDELSASDMILAVGVDLGEYPIASMKIRDAARKGAQLWVLDPRDTKLADYASEALQVKEEAGEGFLLALLFMAREKGLVDEDFVARHTENYQLLEEKLENSQLEDLLADSGLTAEDLSSLLEAYAGAERPMLVMGDMMLSSAAIELLAHLALMLGRLGKPRQGIILLRGRCNSQGVKDLGISPQYLPGYQPVAEAKARESFASHWQTALPEEPGKDCAQVLDDLKEGKIKAVFVLGEDPHQEARECLSKAELLVVQDLFLTEMAQEADVVLPGESSAEKKGTFVNSDRRVQQLEPAFAPLTGYNSCQLLGELMKRMGAGELATTPEKVWSEIRLLVPIFAELSQESLSKSPHWPGRPVISPSESRKFSFTLPESGGKAFPGEEETDSLEDWFTNFLQEKGL